MVSPSRAMSMKSALRIYLSVSYVMKSILLTGSLRSPGRLYGFRRQRQYKKWRRRRRTSPAGTVSQPIGKPFNGQAKGLLWLTWRSYAGPPQYYIPPEGGALNPSGRRQPVPDRTLGAQGQRPGGAINPRGEAASTFGNTGKRRIPHKGP